MLRRSTIPQGEIHHSRGRGTNFSSDCGLSRPECNAAANISCFDWRSICFPPTCWTPQLKGAGSHLFSLALSRARWFRQSFLSVKVRVEKVQAQKMLHQYLNTNTHIKKWLIMTFYRLYTTWTCVMTCEQQRSDSFIYYFNFFMTK